MIIDNDIVHMYYRIAFQFKDGVATMKFGHCGLVQAHLMTYAVKLFGKIENLNVKRLYVREFTADPSTSPTTANPTISSTKSLEIFR